MLTHSSFLSDQRGFTMAELLVAMVLSMLVLGGAVSLTSQVQQGYRRQIEEAAAEQEGRYALDWVSRLIRSAANDPYNLSVLHLTTPGECPNNPTVFTGLILDPNLDGTHDDIRLQTDSNPPDRLLGGTTGNCNQPNEDVTVSYDATARAITFLDNNLGGAATIRTEAVITGMQFIYRDSARNNLNDTPPIDPAAVMYVETRLTVQPRLTGVNSGLPLTRTMTQEVRIRGRNY